MSAAKRKSAKSGRGRAGRGAKGARKAKSRTKAAKAKARGRRAQPRKVARRSAPAARAATAARKKVAPRKAARARAPAAQAAATPPAPPPWTEEIRDLNVVWYSVTDWERAKRFYGETLGLPVAFGSEEMGWIEYGTALPHLAIGRWNRPTPLPLGGGATAVLTCPDVHGTVEILRARGVRCDEPEEIPGMVILATFYDPDGNKLQLAQSLAT